MKTAQEVKSPEAVHWAQIARALAVLTVATLVLLGAGVARAEDDAALKAAVKVIEEYKAPGLESELSGIYPHPTDPDLYYVVANQRPVYRDGQKPVLAEQYRGKLLTVDRWGKVVKATSLLDGDYGDLAFKDGHLFVALLDPAEIVEFAPETGKVVRRIALSSPAGGLEYDRERDIFIAQLYVDHPHLAVVDAKSGATRELLWSDESAMGLAKVDGDWLCTWASGWDPGSYSELRILDPKTGHVRSRMKLNGVHSSLAPSGSDTFISLVTVNSYTGESVIRKYSYKGEARRGQS